MAVYTITLGFVPARILAKSLEAYAATRNPLLPYRHVLVDQHYPVDKARNRAELRAVCAEFGVEVLDPGRNLGLHLGFNWAMAELPLRGEDIIIAYDGDSMPLGQGWDLALVRAIEGDREGLVVWSSLMNPRSKLDLEARGFDHRKVDGYLDLLITRTAVCNSVCAWRYSWLQKCGGLTEPTAFYGHLEAAMWRQLDGKQWAFLEGWAESDELRYMHDEAYTNYKWAHAHHMSWVGDFESWLEAGQPMPKGG